MARALTADWLGEDLMDVGGGAAIAAMARQMADAVPTARARGFAAGAFDKPGSTKKEPLDGSGSLAASQGPCASVGG